MSEIEIGEYVRTTNGYIRKVMKEFDENNNCYIVDEVYYNEKIGELSKGIRLEDIVNHSKNVIKLINAGDYVNGMEVYKGKTASGKEKLLVGNHIINGMALEFVSIKSIITKEQFKEVQYEVGD